VNAAGLKDVAARVRTGGIAVSEHRLDVADAAAVAAFPEAVLAEHGRVTVLVNNAGVALGGTFEQVPAADFEWLFGINFWGVVNTTRAFLPVLRREGAAQIVHLSSVFGIIAPPGQVAYAASKFAVRGFSEALRHELEGSSIGVTVVHPGGVRTSVDANARRTGLTAEEAEQQRRIGAKLLRLPPEAAAERIVRGIERREKRVLVGRDAQQIALIQRVFPVGYWRLIARQIERAMGAGARG
jgi:short-subunit dehydrogenase